MFGLTTKGRERANRVLGGRNSRRKTKPLAEFKIYYERLPGDTPKMFRKLKKKARTNNLKKGGKLQWLRHLLMRPQRKH